MTDIDVRIQWHAPDGVFACVFLRDGGEWYLNGALVGMGGTPQDAVEELLGQAKHLVLHGENFLTEGPIDLDDRRWLFRILDSPGFADGTDDLYLAMRPFLPAPPP